MSSPDYLNIVVINYLNLQTIITHNWDLPLKLQLFLTASKIKLWRTQADKYKPQLVSVFAH